MNSELKDRLFAITLLCAFFFGILFFVQRAAIEQNEATFTKMIEVEQTLGDILIAEGILTAQELTEYVTSVRDRKDD